MSFQMVGVVGAGVMGTGVAQCLAQTGHRVTLLDVSTHILEHAREQIATGLKFSALFDQAMRGANQNAILAQIEFTMDYDRLKNVDLVVENCPEQWDVKQAVYLQIDRICHAECIFVANTSTISISRIAAVTDRPDRVIGIHFMNPVPQKPVVEVIKGQHTSDATVEVAQALLQQIGKQAVFVKDLPGFVSNRVMMVAINEAIGVIQDDIASPAEVDFIFVGCLAHKMGPLATADLIGLDTVLRSLESLYEHYLDSKYIPCTLLRDMVGAGLLGRKSGHGFFSYGGEKAK